MGPSVGSKPPTPAPPTPSGGSKIPPASGTGGTQPTAGGSGSGKTGGSGGPVDKQVLSQEAMAALEEEQLRMEQRQNQWPGNPASGPGLNGQLANW